MDYAAIYNCANTARDALDRIQLGDVDRSLWKQQVGEFHTLLLKELDIQSGLGEEDPDVLDFASSIVDFLAKFDKPVIRDGSEDDLQAILYELDIFNCIALNKNTRENLCRARILCLAIIVVATIEDIARLNRDV